MRSEVVVVGGVALRYEVAVSQWSLVEGGWHRCNAIPERTFAEVRAGVLVVRLLLPTGVLPVLVALVATAGRCGRVRIVGPALGGIARAIRQRRRSRALGGGSGLVGGLLVLGLPQLVLGMRVTAESAKTTPAKAEEAAHRGLVEVVCGAKALMVMRIQAIRPVTSSSLCHHAAHRGVREIWHCLQLILAMGILAHVAPNAPALLPEDAKLRLEELLLEALADGFTLGALRWRRLALIPAGIPLRRRTLDG
mmetsp:Transcript_9404/g.24352  ORF Transcript_9404/g.24352 Transcript_9404/m.24352 type:complete len:251 (-) Transcript_9404:267-1019(-)